MITFYREHLQTLNGTWQSMSSSSCCRYSALSQTNQISWLTNLHKTSNTCTNKVNHIQIFFYGMKKRRCIFLHSYLALKKRATRKTNKNVKRFGSNSSYYRYEMWKNSTIPLSLLMFCKF